MVTLTRLVKTGNEPISLMTTGRLVFNPTL